ncbi:MAG: TonB-dependent receptor [Bacteroidia bacterium]
MRIITTILISIFCFGSLNAKSITINGQVLCDKDSEPITNAVVVIHSLNKVVHTDHYGKYEAIIPSGLHKIEAFGLNRASIIIQTRITRDTTIVFKLSKLSIDLDAIDIVAEKSTNGMARLASVEDFGIYESKKNEVIVLDDFAANKATNNARQVFAKVPGLNIWESDFAGLQLDIAARGLGPSRTANFNTRQNGYDMSADALGYPESYYTPPMQAVEKIEVIRGAASLQYGTQFGGMLNFKIKEAPNKPLEVNAEQSIGSFGLSNTFLSAGGTKGKIDYYTYYQYKTGKGWRENSGFDAQTAFARIGYQLNTRIKLGLEYSYMKYVAQQPGGVTDQIFDNGDLTESLRNRNWFNVNWNLAAATFDYRITENTRINFKGFGLNSGRDALGNLEQIGVPDNPFENRTLISDQFKNYGAEARFLHEYEVKEKEATLIAGFRYYQGLTKRQQGLASADSTPTFKLLNPEVPEHFNYEFPSQNESFFIENLFHFNEKLSVTTGFRLEHIRTDAIGTWRLNRYDFAGNLVSSTQNFDESSTTRWVPLYGIGASYHLNEKAHFYTNYARNFRSITFSDLRVVNPNFQLDSLITDENGFNMDFGIRGAITNWLNADVSFFMLKYNDRIGQYEMPGSTTLLRTNIGDSRHVGIEIFGEANIFKLLNKPQKRSSLALFVNLAATDARYIESEIGSIANKKVEYVPSLMLRTGLNYKFKGFKATFQASYVSEQFSDATNSTFNPNALTGTIPSYLVIDLSLEYEVKHYRFSTGVNNLSNERYFTRRAESYPGPGIIPATPRSFYLSVGVMI